MNSIYASVITDLRQNGKRVSNTVELLNYSVTLLNPAYLDITDRNRKFNIDYAFAEFLWYLGANRSVGDMDKMASIWGEIKDADGDVESNYGSYLFAGTAHNCNWQIIKDELLNNNDSRRAIAPIFNATHYHRNMKDWPCTGYIQFILRDNEIHLIWNMRSCDAIFGLCNDMFCASMFLQLMRNDLSYELKQKIDLGMLVFNIGSLHIYDRHFDLLFSELACRSYPGQSWKMTSTYTDSLVQSFGIKPDDTVKKIKKKVNDFKYTQIKGGNFYGPI
jgi:thymidylate synthase